jgi:hypothetical protein
VTGEVLAADPPPPRPPRPAVVGDEPPGRIPVTFHNPVTQTFRSDPIVGVSTCSTVHFALKDLTERFPLH